MQDRTIARYGWVLIIVISLGEDVNKRLTDSPVGVDAIKDRMRDWDAEITHDSVNATVTFSGTVYATDFRRIDEEVSDVLYRMGASPNRVIVLNAVRGSRVAM